jgi:hypothetical protein
MCQVVGERRIFHVNIAAKLSDGGKLIRYELPYKPELILMDESSQFRLNFALAVKQSLRETTDKESIMRKLY